MTSTSSSSLAQLVSLGIPKVKAVYALKEFDNNAEVAADWCFTVRFPLSLFHPLPRSRTDFKCFPSEFENYYRKDLPGLPTISYKPLSLPLQPNPPTLLPLSIPPYPLNPAQ